MKKPMTVGEAIDDFAENVLPLLFKGERRSSRGYYRVKALLYARKAEKEGRRPKRKVSDTWAAKILSEFAPGRYRVEKSTVFYLNEDF